MHDIYTEQPRYADTVELNLLDILTIEAQEAEQLAYVREWAASDREGN